VRAEFALFAAAAALSIVALLVAPPRIGRSWRVPSAVLLAFLGAITPLVVYQFLDPSLAAGRALWEWSAAGGPTIQASYRLDALAAVAITVGAAYAGAGLLASARTLAAPRALPALVLAIGFAFIATVVADDVVAATVGLAVVAAATAFTTLVVAPAPSALRFAAYLAIGLQGFVVATLLIASRGGASLVLAEVPASAVSPGALLAATTGAALFAGLYPFVPWRYERAHAPMAEREPLRGLLAMPAGVAASFILLRLLGATSVDPAMLALPSAGVALRAVLATGVLATFVVRARRRGRASRRAVIVTALALAILAAYPELRWSHIVLAAALVTVLYAAAVSLALPEQWEVARHDVTLATLWVAFAVGTPLAIGAGLFALVGAAIGALAESVSTAPHRAYLATVATAAWRVTGIMGVGLGAIGSADPVIAVAATAMVALALALELVQAGRRLLLLRDAPPDLEIAAGVAALIGTALLGTMLAQPIPSAVAELGLLLGPLDPSLAIGVAVLSALAVVVARRARPLLPALERLAARLQDFVWAADPVPAGIAAFRALERAVTLSSAGFALFEQRAGVWLATILIVALLIWSARP